MTKGILIGFILMLNLSVTAQTNDSWLNYLESVKNQFFLKDTIVFTYKIMEENDYLKFLKSVKAEDCKRFFKLLWDLDNCESLNKKYFYSYHLSKNNYATLTFFSYGKYTPVLTLYNYSPSGELLSRIEVKSSFGDAGQADSTVTHFQNDSTFVVRRWDGWEETKNGNSVLADSTTQTKYFIKPNGLIVQGKQSHNNRTR